MKDDIEMYLKEVLWDDVRIRPFKGAVDMHASFSRYAFWRVQGLCVDFVLVTRQAGQTNPPAATLSRDIDALRRRIPMWLAYGTDIMTPTERSRLIRRRLPFIVSRRHVYLPFLGFALREGGCPHPAKWLGVSSQHLLLAALRGEVAGPISDLTGERIATCSRATIYRAFRELESFGFIKRTPHGPAFVEDLPRMVAAVQPRLKQSVVREVLERELDRLLLP